MEIIKKILFLIWFFFFYIYEIILSNFKIAHDILTPTDYYRDGIIEVPVKISHPIQVAILMNLITMTPGTIAVDYVEEKNMLLVHLMFLDEAEELTKKIKTHYTRFILELSWS